MLYIGEDSGRYYQEKYMYDDVYLAANDRWAGGYSDDNMHEYNRTTSVKLEQITFKQRVTYPVNRYRGGMVRCVENLFPSPYYY